MPRWVLGCPDCNEEFTHSEVSTEYQTPLLDPFAWIGDKPKFPDAGLRVECPNCKKVSVYQRYQLTYKAS